MIVKQMIAALLFALVQLSYAEGPIVTVTGGEFQGTEAKSYKERTYYSFKGIPFAKPPIGELRFENPDTEIEWEGVKTSMNEVPHCAQSGLGYNDGFEDCLYLSVYTPKMPSNQSPNQSLPVLVWIHGGSYITGRTESHQPHLLMDKDMVVVLPQYRLGYLGFMSGHSPEMMGNYAMFDQIAALNWVQNNIAKFGGDPSRVTLGGDCAGSASAITHMTSPKSKGLFHRVLGISGSPLNPWALQPAHIRFIWMISEYFNCPIYNPDLFGTCMKEIPIQEFVDGMSINLETMDYIVGNMQIGPTPIYKNNRGLTPEDHFLPEHPLTSLKDGNFNKVPVLLGITEHVGDYLIDMSIYFYLKYQQEERPKYFKRFMKKFTSNNYLYIDEEIQENMTQYYLPKWDPENIEESLLDLGTMVGDMQYVAGLLATAEHLSEHVSTRLFRFGFDGGPKLFHLRHPYPAEAPPMTPRASHGDEMFFILPETKLKLTSKQEVVANGMGNLIENFVHGREPLPNWSEFTTEGLETLVIDGKGNLENNVPFVDEKRKSWLHLIYENHVKIILEQLIETKPDDTKEHDEL